jgi:hypothetical protein
VSCSASVRVLMAGLVRVEDRPRSARRKRAWRTWLKLRKAQPAGAKDGQL